MSTNSSKQREFIPTVEEIIACVENMHPGCRDVWLDESGVQVSTVEGWFVQYSFGEIFNEL